MKHKMTSLFPLVILAITACGKHHSSSSSQKENQPTNEAACLTTKQEDNVRVVFNDFASRGTVTGNAKFSTNGGVTEEGTGEFTVTPQSDSSWHINGKICGLDNVCANKDTTVLLKDNCLFYDGTEAKPVSISSTMVNTVMTRTANGQVQKDFTNISVNGNVAIKTSTTVDGVEVETVTFQE